MPLASVTTAWRETSVGLRGIQLRLRFVAGTGAWGRVLVAGRPIPAKKRQQVFAVRLGGQRLIAEQTMLSQVELGGLHHR